MTEPRLRTVGSADLPIVQRLIAESFDPRYGEAWSERDVSLALGWPRTWFRLASCGEDTLALPAGFLLARTVADETELLLIGVRPDHRRMGIGRALVEDLLRQGDDAATSVFLEVRADNESAIALYHTFGFSTVGLRPSYYRGKDGKVRDALTLRLPRPQWRKQSK